MRTLRKSRTAIPRPGRISRTWIKALGPSTSFRYGGGAWADAYDWQTNVDTYAAAQNRVQSNDFTLGHGYASNALDYLNFDSYMDEVQADGAQGLVTVNYGSGTPELAAAWARWIVAQHDPVTQFNIGNEPYGCGEVNFPITTPPANYTGWEPNTTYGCPQYTMGSIPGNAADRAVVHRARAGVHDCHQASGPGRRHRPPVRDKPAA